jgi:hypothetical protein
VDGTEKEIKRVAADNRLKKVFGAFHVIDLKPYPDADLAAEHLAEFKQFRHVTRHGPFLHTPVPVGVR